MDQLTELISSREGVSMRGVLGVLSRFLRYALDIVLSMVRRYPRNWLLEPFTKL